MKLAWDPRAIKELSGFAKGNAALAKEVFEEVSLFAENPAKFPQRGSVNFKMLKNHKNAGRLRVHKLRLFMDREVDTWIVRKVVRRSEKTYK